MLRTIILLLFTIIVVPIISFYYTEPLSDAQIIILKNVALIALGIALGCFLVSEIADNYSQTDKMWSIAPIIYTWYITWSADMDSRLVLMTILVTLWGLRLTYNFNRRGGYSWKFWEGEEDYRWAIVRKKPFLQSKWRWRLFNLFFIALYQNTLILLFTLPILAAYNGKPISWMDYALAFLFLFFLIIETIADQQQWNFQTRKHKLIKEKKALKGDYLKGFLTSGLWAYARHPNYFAEQAIWIVFYLFSVVATGNWINWSIIGCLLLVLLFYNSSVFSEEITATKYPDYKKYQARVGRFLL